MSLFDEIKKEAKPFFKNAKGSHDWDHVERVYNLCLRIGKEEFEGVSYEINV
jgi:HD superfamily phosphodiesterase